MKKFLSLVAVMAVAVMASSTVWAASFTSTSKAARATFGVSDLVFEVNLKHWSGTGTYNAQTTATQINFDASDVTLGTTTVSGAISKDYALIHSNLSQQPANTIVYIYTNNKSNTTNFVAVSSGTNGYSGLVRKGQNATYVDGDYATIQTKCVQISSANVTYNTTNGPKDAEFLVENTTKTPNGVYLHSGHLIRGESIAVSEGVICKVNIDKRKAIMRNHTSAHLLQASLRKVLGNHVEQAGQFVNENCVRFDFVHFAPMTTEEICKVEMLVNDEILKAYEVEKKEMPIDEAKKLGAMALFGEKYGDVVRVVKAGDFSIELCGGTHVDNLGQIGLFKIISESSVAAGVRRIEAITGYSVLNYLNEKSNLLSLVANTIKASNVTSVGEKAISLMNEMKLKDRQIEKLSSEIASGKTKALLENVTEIGSVKLVYAYIGEATPDSLRQMCDMVKEKGSEYIGVIAGSQKEKGSGNICVVCGKDAIAQVANAGNIAKQVAQKAGGNGGGKPDSAMAGAKNIEMLETAVKSSVEIIKSIIK